MLPPSPSAICLQMERPSPWPPYYDYTNGLNKLSLIIFGNPAPWSDTRIMQSTKFSSFAATFVTKTVIVSPGWLIFNAFWTRLITICWMRSLSNQSLGSCLVFVTISIDKCYILAYASKIATVGCTTSLKILYSPKHTLKCFWLMRLASMFDLIWFVTMLAAFLSTSICLRIDFF